MRYPVIAEYDGEIFLILDESSITKMVEPYDIVSGCCRFWDPDGFALRPRVQGCFSHSVPGLLTSRVQVIEQQDAVVSFGYCNVMLPDINGLKNLLDSGLLMDHETRKVVMDICNR